jgi:CRP-like cAMP-binding protein
VSGIERESARWPRAPVATSYDSHMSPFLLLEHLDERLLRDTLSQARRRRFKRNEAIVREGDPGDSLHLIDKGHVAIRITTSDGSVATMRILGRGDQFGEIATLVGSPRNATAVALDDVETLSLHRDVILRLRAETPAIDRSLLDGALREVTRLSNALTEVLYEPVPKRMARHLQRLCEVFDGDLIPLTQDDLAGLCGTTRQTANQILQEMQQVGLITVGRGKVTVVDHAQLARAAR